MRCLSNDACHFGYVREWDPQLFTASLQTAHTEVLRRRFRETRPDAVEPISRFYKLAANGVSNTLRAGTDSARGAFTSPRPIHYRWESGTGKERTYAVLGLPTVSALQRRSLQSAFSVAPPATVPAGKSWLVYGIWNAPTDADICYLLTLSYPSA